jgi:hypothetical protein
MALADRLVQARGWVEAHPRLTRWCLAGPGALVAALAFTLSMAVWFPAGAAGVNHIAWPMVLAPLNWGGLFTYACLVDDLFRGATVVVGLTLFCGALCALSMVGGGA